MTTESTAAVEVRIAQLRELRMALGAFATGVTVITTVGPDGKRHGMTANSFSSVSLEPPLVLWSQSLKTPSHPVFAAASHFAVNVLAEDQVELSNRFARWGEDKFAGLETEAGIGGLPLLADCAATFECTVLDRYPGGDHMVFIGRVERFARVPRRPLIFAGGQYLSGLPLAFMAGPADSGAQDLGDGRVVECATVELARLARELHESIGLVVWGNHGPTIVRWERGGDTVPPTLRTGLVLPVLTSASGMLMSALLPEPVTGPLAEAEAEADPVARLTWEGWTGLRQQIIERGYASTRSSAFPDMYGGDVDAVSVPVHNAGGAFELAMTAVRRSEGVPEGWCDTVASALKAAAERISRQLGGVKRSDHTA